MSIKVRLLVVFIVVMLVGQAGIGAFSRQEIQVGHGYQETVVGDGGIDLTRTGDILADGNITAGGNLTVGGTVSGEGFADVLLPGGQEDDFIVRGAEEWETSTPAEARTTLGFVAPILNRAAPGDIGLTTSATVKATPLIVAPDPNSTIPDQDESSPTDPPYLLTDPYLYIGNDLTDPPIHQFSMHKTRLSIGASQYANRHSLELWHTSHNPSGDVEDQKVWFNFTRGQWKETVVTGGSNSTWWKEQPPLFSVPSRQNWMLFPDTDERNGTGVGTWYDTLWGVAIHGPFFRDGAEVLFGNRRTDDPRSPAIDYVGVLGDARFILKATADETSQTLTISSVLPEDSLGDYTDDPDEYDDPETNYGSWHHTVLTISQNYSTGAITVTFPASVTIEVEGALNLPDP